MKRVLTLLMILTLLLFVASCENKTPVTVSPVGDTGGDTGSPEPPSIPPEPEDPPEDPVVKPSEGSTEEILIGIEYGLSNGHGKAFAPLGIPAIKPLPENYDWSKMQPSLSKPIDFSVTDDFVKEYQENGFTDIVFGLRTMSHNANNKASKGKDNQAPKTEYEDDYANWVRSFVERYDGDGKDDMPGLIHPVKHYEIEVELSSYTPSPIDDYIRQLEIAYEAAHEAYDDVIVGHSAFLTITIFDENDYVMGEYEKAFAQSRLPKNNKHGLKEARKLLDRPDIFDVLNIHSLGQPIEIERIVDWLDYETKQRGYSKPIIISDTAPTPFISFGSAVTCKGGFLEGLIIAPTTEADRCRVADYFNAVLDGDAETLAWKDNFLAQDTVKRVVIAAEQGIALIDTSFTEDLPILNTKLGMAGAGNAGFGGMIDANFNAFTQERTVTGYRAPYYALQHLQQRLKGYMKISREATPSDIRLYKIEKPGETFYIGWYDPGKLLLPEDGTPSKEFTLDVEEDIAVLPMKTSTVHPKVLAQSSKIVSFTPDPVYIILS